MASIFERRPPLFPSYSQRIRDAIDVVEPGGDQCDLKNRFVIESSRAELFMVVFPDLGGVFRELDDVVEHDAFLFGDRSRGVIALKRFDQGLIEGDATQKLCVRVDSIDAPVCHRNHGCDHLVMAPLQGQIR